MFPLLIISKGGNCSSKHDTREVIYIKCKYTKHTLVYLQHVLKIIKYVDSVDSPKKPLGQMNIHFHRCFYLGAIHI